MTKKRSDLLRGTLDLLILKTLSLEPMHGWGIAQRVQQMSQEVFRLNQGSLYPCLQRLEQESWIASGWKETENRRQAKYYSLTESGRRQLEEETLNWERTSAAIARILEAN